MRQLLFILRDNATFCKFILLITFVVLLLVFSITYIFRSILLNAEVEVGSNGALTIKQGKKVTISYLYSATSLWEESGIEVKAGDLIKIHATGKVNLSLGHLVDSIQSHSKLLFDWIDAGGYKDMSGFRDIDSLRMKKRLDSNYNPGMLLMKIKSHNDYFLQRSDSEKILPVGKENTITADHDGRLLFAVNEVLLNKGSEKIFAPKDTHKYNKYYLEKGKQYFANNHLIPYKGEKIFNITLSSDRVSDDELVNIGYDWQTRQWSYICANYYWNVWFEDNIGNFLINIEIIKKN